MSLPEAHLIGGTRPAAVKLAPVAIAMRAAGLLRPVLVAGGRQPEAVTRSLAPFGLHPEITLPGAPEAGRDVRLAATVRHLDELWERRTPAAVLVPGDSTTSLAGALAAYWRRIPVVHVAAGRRSAALDAPFPAENHRRLVAQVAAMHLAPTPLDAMNLLDEGCAAGDVLVTGTTAVDAALATADRLPPADAERPLVLMLVSRLESGGDRLPAAVRALVARYPGLDVVLAARPDAGLAGRLGGYPGSDRVSVLETLPYPQACRLLRRAYLLVTDGLGIEEAPSFGVPALILGDVTERIEALEAGCARRVGTDPEAIVQAAAELLDGRVRRDAMTAGGNPYGDGHAARRAAQATAALLGLTRMPAPMPARIAAVVPGVHA
jgi:UDP-N-acetylglucosamine 2-epimerase (non-hydrolysing)